MAHSIGQANHRREIARHTNQLKTLTKSEQTYCSGSKTHKPTEFHFLLTNAAQELSWDANLKDDATAGAFLQSNSV